MITQRISPAFPRRLPSSALAPRVPSAPIGTVRDLDCLPPNTGTIATVLWLRIILPIDSHADVTAASIGQSVGPFMVRFGLAEHQDPTCGYAGNLCTCTLARLFVDGLVSDRLRYDLSVVPTLTDATSFAVSFRFKWRIANHMVNRLQRREPSLWIETVPAPQLPPWPRRYHHRRPTRARRTVAMLQPIMIATAPRVPSKSYHQRICFGSNTRRRPGTHGAIPASLARCRSERRRIPRSAATMPMGSPWRRRSSGSE